VSFGDRIRRYFSSKKNPELQQLDAFVASHKGIEGYIEPRTTTQSTTLLLVDRDGDSVRASVTEPEAAAAFCTKHEIPVYDARVIGYPKRMREFERRRSPASEEDLDREIADLERRLAESGNDTPND
jgi:hypothetical protein